MYFVADESIDRQVVDILSAHFNVYDISRQNKGASDEKVLEIALSKNAILLTADKDFGELVFRQHKLTAGVILIRLFGGLPEEKAALVERVVLKHIDMLEGRFVVITKKATRFRSALA